MVDLGDKREKIEEEGKGKGKRKSGDTNQHSRPAALLLVTPPDYLFIPTNLITQIPHNRSQLTHRPVLLLFEFYELIVSSCFGWKVLFAYIGGCNVGVRMRYLPLWGCFCRRKRGDFKKPKIWPAPQRHKRRHRI